jgi:hypothetical protein
MKRLKAYRVVSPNGEVHFVLKEVANSEHSEDFLDYKLAEIKQITRKEAAKPLILFREE